MAYNPKIKAEDIRMSQIVSEFTIEQFYNKYVKKLEIVNDRERQTMGIDSIFFIGKTPYRCDEKSAVRWRNLKTFSMELLFLDKNNNEFIGWFLNDQLVNELYLFIWIDKTKSDTILTKNILSKEDIKEAEFALVEKVQIMEYLKKLGWTKDKLLEKAQKIIHNEDKNFGDIKEHGCKFTLSDKLAEKPVNVLIPRKELVKMAMITEKITQE